MATWVASGMDDVTGPSATRLPSWKRTIERKDGTTETQELQYTNAGNDPMEPLHVAIQTESNQPTEVQEISLTAASLALITEALAEGEKTKRFFDRLLPFHSRDSARLQLNRTVPVTAMPSEALQVRFMAVGANGRIALLLAAEQHESWCNHNSHVVVCHWNKQFVLPQAVCPTAAAWGQQGILAVGTYAGNVDLYHGQQLMASTQIHEGPIPALDWSGKDLISCGTDGNVVLLSVRGSVLEKTKTIRLAVSDLPRQIRRGAPSSRPLGIVSLARQGNNVAVASETGGVWRLSLPDLALVPAISPPLAIQKLILLPDGRMVIADVDNRVAFLSPDGSIESESVGPSARWLFTTGTLLVSSDEETLNIVDSSSLKPLFEGIMKLNAVASLGNDEIVILNEHSELQIYSITF